ncbi:unnamed protein product [Symbiodinium necroappetens]|uniref:Uncharacterized protein n=1 Tax=Symbiodinium necroappetens TaxID=1628268 RepID=A0A812SII3_9DINO|nr:unnamed protein product [Symbiodinium necroappetens]
MPKPSAQPLLGPPQTAMPNNLAEFSATLWRIAKCVLDSTLTLLCAGLLLAALCVPWRLPFVVLSSRRETFNKLKDFQAFAASQFLLSMLDILILASVLPSLVWPLRWCRTFVLIKESLCGSTSCRHEYCMELRGELFLNAASSYADLIVLPVVCIALVALWRWTPIHTKSLKVALQEDTWCERLSSVRNWAAWTGLNAILDLPFVIMGLASVAVPSRIAAFWSVLVTRDGFQDREDDCEARLCLFVLPFLSITDVVAALLAAVGVINPFRSAQAVRLLSSCCHAENTSSLGLSLQCQKAVQWNLQLRRRAVLIGLCSLMDVFVLPFSLLVCATVYRAGPLIVQLWPSASPATVTSQSPGMPSLTDPSLGTGDIARLEDDLPFSALHRVAFRQFGLILLDLLTLPSSLLVLLTWYRFTHLSSEIQKVRRRYPAASPVAYHAAVLANSCVVLHDVVLSVCSLSLVFTVYRIRAATRAVSAEEPRLRLWQEIGNLLLDLPFLPLYTFLLVTLWRADLVTQKMFKAENNRDRRSAVLWEFLELLRDFLGWLALLVLAVTLVRLPKVLLDICAQRAQPVAGLPRLQLTHVRLRCPPDHAPDRRLVIHAEGLQDASRARCEIGSIRINVISSRFWEEIGRLLGSGVASLGRALLPYTLVDGKHLDYSGFLPASASIELRLGGKDMKSKLLQLDENMAMCVQIEHKDPRGAVEVLARLPIPMLPLQQAVRSPGDTVEVEEALLTASPEDVCGPLLAGAGIRNALWLCALRELWQLCLDIVHLLLFAFLALAPWRFVACAYFACAPSAVWLAVLTEQAISLTRLKGAMLGLYRGGLEPALNSAAKDPSRRTQAKLCQVVAQEQARTPLPSQGKERALILELQRHGQKSSGFVDKLRSLSSLQDAVASYWPSLTLGANLQLADRAFEPEEHALALLMIAEAQSTADQLSNTCMDELKAESLDFRRAADAEFGRCDLCGKTMPELRRLVQIFVAEGVKDYLTLALAVLLLVSVYRVPKVLRGVFQDRHSGLIHRVRAVLTCQVLLLAWDAWMLCTTVLAGILAMVTLVRTMEFLQNAFLHCSTLREVRHAALRALSEAARHWWELLLLLTFWKTYKTLVHAAVCALLLPAYSLEVGPFLIRIVLWLLLCALPWTTLPFQYVLSAFALVVVGCFALRGFPCRSEATAISAAAPLHLRVTGMNAVVLLCIVAEAALLSSVISLRPLLQQEAFFSASAAVTGLWLLVISLPHTQPEGLSAAQDGHRQGVLGSAKFHAAWQLMRRGLALPAAVVLLLHCGAGGPLGRWSCMLLAFLAFTTALGADMQAHLQSFMPDSLGLDIAQPPTFLAGLTMAQMVFVAQVLYQPDWAWLSMLVSALLPTWVLIFECRQGLAGPAWLLPLQLGASFAPAWSQLAGVLGLSTSTRMAGFSTIVLLSMIGMVTADRRARHRQHKAMLEAEVPKMMEELLHRLNRKGVLLSRLASTEFGGSLPVLENYENPRGLASTLAAFEAATRMERLSTEFLVSRKEWLVELREGRDDYAVVARCGSRLVDAICTPSSTVQTMCLLRRHATRKLPRDIWKMIMSFVSDVRVVSSLLGPVVQHFGGGQPKQQVVRGWEAMNEVGQWLQRQRQATEGDIPEPGEDALAKQLAKWWKGPRALTPGCPLVMGP